MNFDEAMALLEGLELHGVVLGLDRVRKLLSALGNPQDTFRSIHITGTNGKGSTAAYLASVLQKAGYRTGLYTSPHLNRFTERITLSGEEISRDQVAAYTDRLLSLIQSEGPDFHPTYFEVTTAMAFACFAEAVVDFAVVEAGLGGRLDATNVVHPLLTVITNVAIEHTEYLGETLETIAREKGGIIKQGVETITGERDRRVVKVLEDLCRVKESRLVQLGREISVSEIRWNPEDRSRTFTFRGEENYWEGLSLRMLGEFQVGNAAVALGAIECLMRQGVEISENAVREGIEEARWPGRLETISTEPWVVVDGAHNPHAAQALKQALLEDLHYRRLILVIGILQDKDIPAVVLPLLSCADQLILTRPKYYRGADPELFSEMIRQPNIDVQVRGNVGEALDTALADYEKEDLILVTGSLYTVGEAKAYVQSGENPVFNP